MTANLGDEKPWCVELLNAIEALRPSRQPVVEIRCFSVDDLRRTLGIVAASTPDGLVPHVFDGVPVIEDTELLPGQVRAFDATGACVVRHG